MYVIFPAEDLIWMSYGAYLPFIARRPTLDCLPEPLVPISDRSYRSSEILAPRPSPPRIQVSAMHSYNDQSSREPSVSRLSLTSGDEFSEYERYARDRSPSIFLEPPTPGGPSSRPVSPTNASKSNQKTSRLRPKLKISLGRLGRQKPDLTESNRLRQDLHIHVENPTFTHENIQRSNFDAFFESGEPVYKLEPKLPSSATPDPYAASLTSQDHLDVGDGFDSKKARSMSLFGRSKPLLDKRSKSAEYDNDRQAEVPQKGSWAKFSAGQKRRNFFGWRGPRGGSLSPQASMASYAGVLKDYGHSNLTEAFKSHHNHTFKLIKTVSDFTETLSRLHEEHAVALQSLVSTFRIKNSELRKERPSCQSSVFQAWETFLQEVEADSQSSSDVASTLSRQVSRPMLDKSFHRKIQSRKIFTHRESFETIIAKTEEKLSKCRMDYKQCYLSHRQSPTQLSLTEYIDSHNAYVQQLHATNAMLETYHCDTIPQLMQELEEIYSDLCSIIAEAVLQGADVIASKASQQTKRYNSLSNQCQSVSPQQDLTNLVRVLPLPTNPQKVPKRVFTLPQSQVPPVDTDNQSTEYNENAPLLRNELVLERHSSTQLRPAMDSLKREAADLEIQIRQLQDSVETLLRTQTRSIENQLYNKVNELQEDLSIKKFDLRAKFLHLSAVRAQRDLFYSKADPGSPRDERKLSAPSTPSMKTKWLKAFRSLKPASGSAPSDRRNGSGGAQPLRPNEDGSHHLQEYTYKKITPCDVCSQILRGHTRQGLRCRICKLNSHPDCSSQLPKCQAKQKLLRRQKSTSEIENRVEVEEEKITDIDQIYRVLKQAGDIPKASDKTAAQPKSVTINTEQQEIPIVNVNVPERPERATGASRRGRPPLNPVAVAAAATAGSKGLSAPSQDVSSCSAPHSPRRQKLNLRMKSLSLDSPESTELHGHIRRRQPGPAGPSSSYYHGGSGGHLEHSTPPSNNSRLHSPSSPSHQRKLLYANRGLRTGSVDLPDDVEKSLSSASTSPCPSPVRQSQKSHRLLPTNLYVILYNFKARHGDELDLKAGYKVTVIDTSDPDWWKGKLLGRVGFFPSKYCARLNAGEKPLQVTHNLQVSDGERGENMTLLRDQIVIQTEDESSGMVRVRSADNRQGYCPIKYLQEV